MSASGCLKNIAVLPIRTAQHRLMEWSVCIYSPNHVRVRSIQILEPRPFPEYNNFIFGNGCGSRVLMLLTQTWFEAYKQTLHCAKTAWFRGQFVSRPLGSSGDGGDLPWEPVNHFRPVALPQLLHQGSLPQNLLPYTSSMPQCLRTR